MAPSLQIQSVLYNNQEDAVERALQSAARAAELAVASGRLDWVSIRLGDSSQSPCLSDNFIRNADETIGHLIRFEYVFFNGNLGSAKGQNVLAAGSDADYLLLMNPDVVMSPRALENLVQPFSLGDVGMTEAKQLPIEHPKDYDPISGDTSWVSGACSMIPRTLFEELKGYDSDSFFLYCDDVDLAWRVRLTGKRVVFTPSAVVFHDKRLSDDARWQPTSSEQYYSCEAAMLLAHKWSREDLADEIFKNASIKGTEFEKKAAAEFDRRKRAGTLAPQLDRAHAVGYFANHQYAKHRYVL